MCGIAGIWNVGEGQSDSTARVSAMLGRMAHRGPDGHGLFAYEGGAAGMVRLALVDLSDRGQQPLWSADQKVAILFNGEIYNFREHRKRLADKGYCFQSKTDSEVILALYLEHGEEFVHYLRGMYAIALFDWRRTRPGALPELLLVRGPLGIKPLYVAPTGKDGSGCVFASEIRAILASELTSASVDPEALRDYLRFGFIVQPRTILSGVRMLEPGTLERHVAGKPVHVRRFWSMPAYEPRKESFDEAADRLRQTLEESVGLHAFADAKVGAFLSGGIDSNGIVGLMRKHLPRLRTYTLRFPEFPASDESAAAQASAVHFDCENTIVDVVGSDVCDLLPRFAGDLDQPSTDGLNTWIISRAAARDVKGILSGLGGDEWFAGYPCARRMLYHAASPRGRALAKAGQWARQFDALVPKSLFPGRVRERVENLAARRNLLSIWLQTHNVFSPEQVRGLTGDSAEEDPTKSILGLFRDPSDGIGGETPVGLCSQLDVAAYMRCQLLRDSDATSMAHSLELRVPYVDTELARFARTCKDEYKIDLDLSRERRWDAPGGKRVLLEALRNVVPQDVQARPKRGFELPLAKWVSGPLREMLHDNCSSSTVKNRGLVNPQVVEALMSAGRRHPSLHFPKAWSLLILELWCQATLDRHRSTRGASENGYSPIVLSSMNSTRQSEFEENVHPCERAVLPR